MTYPQTLDYLYHTLPMFSRIGPAAFKKDLINTIALCNALGNPQKKFKAIHIGGTNGKGSVSHMLAAIMQTAGYKTGLYTSPHLYDFRERIKIDGRMVSENFVVQFVEKVKPLIEEIKPSFFEITVAMAFQYFAEQQADIAVIEVGLGGRLDSTNIITPELSIITNISWDHMNMLGDTLQKIATEKAGIIKPAVPVVIGERQPATAAVFEATATEKVAPVYFADDRFHVTQFQTETTALHLEIEDRQHGVLKKFTLDLPGIYQLKNAVTVLQAAAILTAQGFKLNDAIITKALSQTKTLTGLKGRWEVVHHGPDVVLEVAHNEAGVQQMLAHLQQVSYKKLHLIIGTVKDKAPEAVLRLLPASAQYYFTQAQIPRALDANTLQQKAVPFGLHGDSYSNVNEAIIQAMATADVDDLIVVCGSIFLVAEADATQWTK